MSGRLAAAKPAAATPTTLYTVPNDTLASITISACNQGTAKDMASIQLCDGSPVNNDYIEYTVEVSPAGVLERSGIVLREGQNIVVTSLHGDVSFVAWGITESL